MTTCIIIDDEVMHREIDLYALKKVGFDTREAPNGKAALEVCRHCMPDVILLDLVMPEMNGFEFLSTLRSVDEGKKPFVLVCSANGMGDIKEKVLEYGANSFLLKPFSTDMLKEKLAEASLTSNV